MDLSRLAKAARSPWTRFRHLMSSMEERMVAMLIQRAVQRGDHVAWMRRHDALTGLLNRLAFTESARALLARNVSGALAVLDLDHFKQLNNQHGHLVGDQTITALAARLQSTLTADILIARYGGEEFALFIPGDMARARPLMDRLLSVVRQPIELPACTVSLTVSIGLAPMPADLGFDQGLSSADLAMYAAKASGRNRVHEFCNETEGVVTARRELAKTVATLQAKNRELQELVQLDALTGLRSRRSLDQLLERVCGGTEPTADHYAVAFLDIDHFGSYNKHHGDDQGDAALRRVAQVIQQTARRQDLVFRKGGEEIVGVASSQDRGPVTVHQLMNLAANAAMQAKVLAQRNRVHAA